MNMDETMRQYEPMCHKVAKETFARGLDYDDHVQEARIGLFKAIITYDPTKGMKFSSWAMTCAQRHVWREVKTAQTGKRMVLTDARSFADPIAGTEGLTFGDTLSIDDREPDDRWERFWSLLTETLNEAEMWSLQQLLAGNDQATAGAEMGITRQRVQQIQARAQAKARPLAVQAGLLEAA